MTHMLLNDVQEMRIRIRKDPSLAVIRRACPAVYFPSTNPKTKGEKGVEERRRKEGKKGRKGEDAALKSKMYQDIFRIGLVTQTARAHLHVEHCSRNYIFQSVYDFMRNKIRKMMRGLGLFHSPVTEAVLKSL